MHEYQKGQILLIVVLIMVTALTVGLSVAARSITDTKTSEESSNSERAFSAAEAGIEKSITALTNRTITGSFTNNSTYNASVQTVSGNNFLLNNGYAILKDDSTDIWLSTYPTYASPRRGPVTVYWGQSTDTCSTLESRNTMAAIELFVLDGTAANPKVTRYAYDPCGARATQNNFTVARPAPSVVMGKTFRFRETVTVNSGLFVRVIPLYAPALAAASGCNGGGGGCVALPSQGTVIQATGNSGSTERKLITYHFFPKLPTEILQYSLFVPQ